jgi:hypothetical protein
MGFFSFIVLLAIAYLIWRVTDQLPDLIFRMSEIQRDVAEIRRRLAEQDLAGQDLAGQTPTGQTPTGQYRPPEPESTLTTGGPARDPSGADQSGI